MKRYFTLPSSPELEPNHLMKFSVLPLSLSLFLSLSLSIYIYIYMCVCERYIFSEHLSLFQKKQEKIICCVGFIYIEFFTRII